MTISKKLPSQFLIQADYGECCIWTDDGGASLDIFDVPNELKERANIWVSNYFEDEASPAGQTRQEYILEGLDIAKTLKHTLGHKHEIKYRYFDGDFPNIIWKTLII